MPENAPRIALTLGDVAGIGPEVLLKAWTDPRLLGRARPFVVGRSEILRREADALGLPLAVRSIDAPEDAEPSAHVVPCLDVGPSLADVPLGRVDPRAGRGAYDFLVTAIGLALPGRVDAIVTLPLNKESLHLAGVRHPGHTEILAQRCGVPEVAMMLYLNPQNDAGTGFGVVHATLHVPLRRVFDLLTIDRVAATIALADSALRPLSAARPRVAVAGLNPHAGENGLFGDEEERIISPAVARARDTGIDAVGPVAADTLFARALAGEFDAVVAMYHDQGHVALKTVGFDRAVNVTLGLPIVRTSVAHGTAFDIAGQGRGDPSSLLEAVRTAVVFAKGRAGAPGAPELHGIRE